MLKWLKQNQMFPTLILSPFKLEMFKPQKMKS